MEVHSAIYDSKILNLWTTKPCFEIIHGFLVSVFDKVCYKLCQAYTFSLVQFQARLKIIWQIVLGHKTQQVKDKYNNEVI